MAACAANPFKVEHKTDDGDRDTFYCSAVDMGKEKGFRFDPKFKPKSITMKDATNKKLIVFVLIGAPGVGKSFFFNMLCRSREHDTGNNMGGGKVLDAKNPNLWQISKASCVLDTMGMLDIDPEVDAQARELMTTILRGGLNRVRIIFISDTRKGRLPREIVSVADDLLEAIKNKAGVDSKYNLFLTSVPNEYLKSPDTKIKYEAKIKTCWDKGMDDWAEGLGDWVFMCGVSKQYKQMTEKKQVAPVLPPLWQWLHHLTTEIKIDPTRKYELKKLSAAEIKKKMKVMAKRIKKAEKDKKAHLEKEKKLKEELYNEKVWNVWTGVGLSDVGAGGAGGVAAGHGLMAMATPIGWAAAGTVAMGAAVGAVGGKAIRYANLSYPSDEEKEN